MKKRTYKRRVFFPLHEMIFWKTMLGVKLSRWTFHDTKSDWHGHRVKETNLRRYSILLRGLGFPENVVRVIALAMVTNAINQ
jgi:hypothetical protein